MPRSREKVKQPDRFQQSRWVDLVQQRDYELPPHPSTFWDNRSVAAVFIGLILGVLMGVPLGAYVWLHLAHQ